MPSAKTSTRDAHRRTIARGKPGCAYEHCLFPGEPIDYKADYRDPRSYAVDHIIPTAKGGSDTLDNKQPMHRACNRDKSDKLEIPTVARTFVTSRTW